MFHACRKSKECRESYCLKWINGLKQKTAYWLLLLINKPITANSIFSLRWLPALEGYSPCLLIDPHPI